MSLTNPLLQREMSVALVNENRVRLEDVRGDLDQIRHWVATQVGGSGQQMLCSAIDLLLTQSACPAIVCSVRLCQAFPLLSALKSHAHMHVHTQHTHTHTHTHTHNTCTHTTHTHALRRAWRMLSEVRWSARWRKNTV